MPTGRREPSVVLRATSTGAVKYCAQTERTVDGCTGAGGTGEGGTGEGGTGEGDTGEGGTGEGGTGEGGTGEGGREGCAEAFGMGGVRTSSMTTTG